MKAFRDTNYCSYFNFHPLYNISKDHLYRISGSEFYEWLFGAETFSGLSRNRPQVTRKKRKLASYGLAQTSINEDRSVELNLPSIERIVSGEVSRTCEKMG